MTVTAVYPGGTDTGFIERGNDEAAPYEERDLMDPATVADAGHEEFLKGYRIVVPAGAEQRMFIRVVFPRRLSIRAADRAENE